MNKTNPMAIPATSSCPKKYCFFFEEIGDYHAQGPYNRLEAALEELELIKQESCGCPFGRCTRVDSNGDRDWYEPCEPTLNSDGLPHDHFINASLVD